MILINSIDTASFTLNGTRYVKNFVCLPAGQTHIQIVGAYDTKLQILANTHFNQISVDGNTYGSQALLINALANVIFSKSSSSATINQNNVGVFNTTIQYAFTTPSNTILVSEIVNKINLTYGYALSEVMTPYFFQFVRPALQEGSDTPIQKKYIFLFTGGKGSYGLGQTPVASTQFKLIVESVLNPDDIVDDDSAIINYLGEIEDGDYISVANESSWDFFNTDYTYYFSYTTDAVLYYVVFVGEAGLYGVDNVLFTEDDFVDSTNSDALPYIPTLQEIINQGSTATTSNNISLTTTGTGKLLYNGSEVLNTAKKAVANGVASLDGAGKIPVSQLPNAVMIYKGMWNLSTNTPALTNGTGTAGWVYKVTGAPIPTNFNFGSGNIPLTNGDFVIYSDSGTWEKSDGSDAVTSVNGYQGIVDLTYTDVGAAASVHTHSMSDVTGLSTALSGKANVDGSNTNGSTWKANRIEATNMTGGGNQILQSTPTQLYIGNTGVDTVIIEAASYGGLALNTPSGVATVWNSSNFNPALKANDADVIHRDNTNETKLGGLNVGANGLSNTPVLGTKGGKFSVTPDVSAYGLDVGIYSNGKAYFQAHRYDSSVAYDIILNPNGGNIGIGTTTPSVKFQVADNNAILPATYIYNNNPTAGTSRGLLVEGGTDATDYSAQFRRYNGTPIMTIAGNGFVGIGNVNPTYKLDITGDARVSANFDVNGTLTVNGNSYSLQRFQSSGTDRGYIGQGDYAIPSASPTGLGLGAINDLQLGAGNTVRMTLKSDGNVGIGTALASISAKLDVNGDIYARGKIRTDDGTNSYHAATVGQLNTAISAVDTNTLHTTGNEVKITGTTAFIDKVAIGTSSISAPSAKFTVSGSTDLFGVLNVSSSASFGGEVLVATADGSSPYAAVNIDYLDNKLNSSPRIIADSATSAYTNTGLNTAYAAVAIGTQVVCGGVGTGVIYVKINGTGGGTWRQMYLTSL